MAAEALGNIGPAAKTAVPALAEALGNKNSGVRSAAALASATSVRAQGSHPRPHGTHEERHRGKPYHGK